MAEEQAQVPLIPVSWGEVIDKITILHIKRERISEPAANANVRKELEALEAAVRCGLSLTEELLELRDQLMGVNNELWEVEDRLREHERAQDFGREFVELARAVYRHNDRRAALKRLVNICTSSSLMEEKSYS